MLEIKHFGQKSLNELKDYLKIRDLNFSLDVERFLLPKLKCHKS